MRMNVSRLDAKFIVDCKRNLVKATTDNAAFQLYNEGIIEDGKHLKDTWYPINSKYDEYGWWVLKNEFPNIKGGEAINVEYINNEL